METTSIYTLAHPLTKEIRYVGKSNNIQRRLYTHITDKSKTHKVSWIKSLVAQGLRPIIEVLDIVPSEDWQFWEVYWISQMKAWGHRLCNGDNGGNGPAKTTPEIRRKLSEHFNTLLDVGECAQYDKWGTFIKRFPCPYTASQEVGIARARINYALRTNCLAEGFFWRAVDAHQGNDNITTHYTADGKRRVPQERIIRMLNTRVENGTTGVGRKHSEERKKRSRQTKEARYLKKVEMLTMEGQVLRTWACLLDAARETGFHYTTIRAVCLGKHQHAGGVFWRYDGSDNLPLEAPQRRYKRDFIIFDPSGKQLGTWYNQTKAAEDVPPIRSRTVLKNLLNGVTKSFQGYTAIFVHNINLPAPATCVS